MRSRLYVGRVRHTRLRPRRHDFTYRVFYLMLDLDQLELADRRHRWFSVDRFNLFSFHRTDHGPEDATSLREWAEEQLAEAGVDLGGGRIELLAFPRVLGYVFNPISIWYCYDRDGSLAAVMHEVRNTFGEKRTYVVPVGGDLSHRFPKELHVSPFMDMDQTYSFAITVPRDRFSVGIRQYDADGEIFRAGLSGTVRPIGDGALLRVFVTHPLMTLKAIGAIHWHAVRLWLKGVRYRRRPRAPRRAVSIVDTERAS